VKRLVLLVAAVVFVGALASPVAAQQTTDTPTPDSDGEEGTPLPVTSPSGSPVSYDSPTPTSSGSGPGFGAVGALVAAALAAMLAVRRRT
jgi:PGF-CTERM protein